MSAPGLTLTRQAPAQAITTITLGEDAPATLWRKIATSDGFQDALKRVVNDLLAETHYSNRGMILREAGATCLDGGYATVLTGLDRFPEDDRFQDALEVTASFGQGDTTIVGPSPPLESLPDGPLAVFEADEQTQTIAIRVENAFREVRAEHRREVCRLIAMLAEVFDVRLVTTTLLEGWLVRKHCSELPVSPKCSTGDPSEVATVAIGSIDPEGRRVDLLRDLAAEPDNTLPYRDLQAKSAVSDSRIRQCITDDKKGLEPLDLVRRYESGGELQVELTEAGEELLAIVDREIGVQQTLSESVSGDCKSCGDSVKSRGKDVEGESGTAGVDQPPGQSDGLALPRRYSEWEATAAKASAMDADIRLVDHPIADLREQGDIREGFVRVNQNQDELVVGVQFVSPLQCMTSLAFALTSSTVFESLLTPDRLDTEVFGDEITNDGWFLRQTRQLGYLSEKTANGEDFIGVLKEAKDDLQKLTGRVEHGNYSETQRKLRSKILRHAHGLIGTVTHLLDLCEIDLVREVRVPEFSRNLSSNEKGLHDLLVCLTKAVSIASHYDGHVAERILFEEREDKREAALCAPDVDPREPEGSHIGSWVIVGRFGETLADFRDRLQQAVQNPGELQEEGRHFAEFEIPIEIETGNDRTAHAVVANQLLESKRIRPRDEAITRLQALTGSVYDAAEALNHLGSEDYREIESRDLKYALAQLESDQLLPDQKPSVGKIVHELLQADQAGDGPLSKKEIAARRSDLSERSVYDKEHWVVLEELELVREVEDGWVINLSLPSDRGNPDLPWWEETDVATRRDVLSKIEKRFAPADVDYLHDPPPAYKAIMLPPDWERLVELWPWIESWFSVIDILLKETENPRAAVRTITVRFGAEPSQKTVQTTLSISTS